MFGNNKTLTSLLSLIIFAPTSLLAQTKEALPDSYYLLLGRIQATLSAEAISSQQAFGGNHVIWMDARLGRVPRDEDTKLVGDEWTGMVPNDTGIIVIISPPFDPYTVQGFRNPFYSAKLRAFVLWALMPNKMIVQVSGTHGESFSEPLLKALFNVVPPPPVLNGSTALQNATTEKG